MATAARDANGSTGYLRSAFAPLATPRLALPVLLLLLVLTATNIAILMNVPPEGGRPGAGFFAAAAVRVIALLVLVVAILRIVNSSPRRPFTPDGGFWLYLLSFGISVAVTVPVRLAVGADDTLPKLLLVNAISAALLSPLAAWFVALAVAKPAPLSPARWVRGLSAWLPYFLLWTLLIVTPLAALHGAIDYRLVGGAGDAFWVLALFDGPLSTVMALVSIALGSEAYRRVARS